MALTQVSPGLLNAEAQAQGFRNRIINGAMVIDQRNAGATVSTPSDGQYILDRFRIFTNGGGVYSVGQSSVAPDGFTNSMLFTVTTADSSISATDYYLITQSIEGYNVADCGFGTASAKTVTISFWVRSSLTGTFGFGLRQGSGTRSYVAEYTISSANTWEYKTITIAGDTSGTWETTTSTGMIATWDLGSGSNYQGTANTWNAGNYWRASGDTNFIATNGATFYITGVQLEVGSVATEFERRPYGTELALCQRYYQQYGRGTVRTTRFIGVLTGTTGVFGFNFINAFRTAPTAVWYGTNSTTGTFTIDQSGGGSNTVNVSSINSYQADAYGSSWNVSGLSSGGHAIWSDCGSSTNQLSVTLSAEL